MTIGDQIVRFYESLVPPAGLPAEVEVLNPYKDEQALSVTKSFYHKFYQDENPRVMLLGINPGRFGGGITGIPFTDPIQLTSKCEIPNSFTQKPELSSKFMYEMIDAYGGLKLFYDRFFFSAISPLGYVSHGKNLNYYDIPNWKLLFEVYAERTIREQLAFTQNRDVAFCIGMGENVKFLTELNQKYELFGKIEALPHPRWIMQYRLKTKDIYIDEYVKKLTF